ncbi:MAG: aspartate carbamoyltransferase [Thermodesulfobacteriota bacterium]
MEQRHIIEAQQFNKKTLQEILSTADRIKERMDRRLPLDLLRGKILGNLFYVKSMRTSLSFDAAMKRLGGTVSNIEYPETFSSELAGGNFEDTVRVVGSLVDVIVLRHHRSGSAKRAAEVSPVPIINGGDGPAQHPTQALIDLYCIEKLKGGIDGVAIAFMGDLMNSRTIRSLTYFLAKYTGVKIYFASPRALKMKDDLKEYLAEHRVPFSESLDSGEELKDIVGQADVLYITQIPKEHFGDRIDDYEHSKEIFRINQEILKIMKKDTYIMHPFPRDYELPTEVDKDPRAVYFDQIQYGQFLRMGLLCLVLRVAVD